MTLASLWSSLHAVSIFVAGTLYPLSIFVAGTVFGAAINPIIAHWMLRYTGPNVEIEAGSDEPFVIQAPASLDSTARVTWARFRVRNTGRSDAKDARAYLTGVAREGSAPFLKEDALLLWASVDGDDGPKKPITIPREFHRYFDLGNASNDKEFSVQADMFNYRVFDRLTPGTYVLSVVVAGSNFAPAEARIRLVYNSGTSISLAILQ